MESSVRGAASPLLDPQARALLDLLVERGIPPIHTQGVPEARAAYRERRALTQPDPPQVGAVFDESLSHEGATIGLRIYRPADSDGTLPALVYYHGGGWTIGDLETHDTLCRSLCAQAGIGVVSVDYRLGPEHRFPRAWEDALAAFDHAIASATRWGFDASRTAVGGDSSGGNLAAAVALARRTAAVPPAFQLLIYPATTMRTKAPSHHAFSQGYLLTHDDMLWFIGNYMGPDSDLDDPRASPLLARDHAGAASALVLTAGFDPLVDDGRAYADTLSAAGVPTQYVCFARQLHGFITMGRVIDEANTAVTLCASALRAALNRG